MEAGVEQGDRSKIMAPLRPIASVTRGRESARRGSDRIALDRPRAMSEVRHLARLYAKYGGSEEEALAKAGAR